ncbi:MAG: hypothetical protein JSV91_02045 [Phycisphaerales bacterium]|nr:MAG: hypothetical protein JSV91_02045 [Phycisphaerales bacterium]
MKRRIIIDGIKVEGLEAKRIIDEVLHDADETGQGRRGAPPGLILGTIIVAGVFSCAAGAAVHRLVGGPIGQSMIGASALTALIAAAVWGRAYLLFHRRRLRMAMRQHGYELCLSCGYWLKGLVADSQRCPECGAVREKTES